MTIALAGMAALVGLAGFWVLRRRSFFWAGALVVGGAGAICYGIGTPAAFKLYYALAASMFPGWVGAGSLYSALGRRAGRAAGVFVLMLSAVQLGLTLPAEVNAAALAALNGSNGEGVLVRGAWVMPTVLFNTLGLASAAIAAFLAWWRAFRVQHPRTAAMAIGLSVVVLGVLARSAAASRMLAAAGEPRAFMALDALAFGLVWAGARLSERLPKPLERALLPAA